MDIQVILEILGFLLAIGGTLATVIYKLASIERTVAGQLTQVLVEVRGFATWRTDHDSKDDERENRTQAELIRLRDATHIHSTDIQALKTRMHVQENHHP